MIRISDLGFILGAVAKDKEGCEFRRCMVGSGAEPVAKSHVALKREVGKLTEAKTGSFAISGVADEDDGNFVVSCIG